MEIIRSKKSNKFLDFIVLDTGALPGLLFFFCQLFGNDVQVAQFVV